MNASTTAFQGAVVIGEMMPSTFTATPGGSQYALLLSTGLSTSHGGIALNSDFLQVSAREAVSTSTIIPDASFSNTVFGDCLPGSTVTLTTHYQQHLAFSFSGSLSADTTAEVSIAIRLDGGFLPEYNGGASALMSSVCPPEDASFFLVTRDPVSSGTHSVCLAAKVSASTATVISNNLVKSSFGVFNIK